MLEYHLSYAVNIVAEDADPDCLTSKLLDRLELRAGDERSGGARHVTGHEFDRNPPDRCGDPGAERRIIIDFSADQCRQPNRGIHPDELCLKSFLLQEAPLLSQGERDI